MKVAFTPGRRVRAKGGAELGTIVRYEAEGFYVVDVVGVFRRDGLPRRLMVHEDDLELAEADEDEGEPYIGEGEDF